MSDRSLRWFALAGPVGAVLGIVGALISGSTPSEKATGPRVLAFYDGDETTLIAGAALIGVGSVLIVLFAAHLRTRLRDPSPTADAAAIAALAGGILLGVGLLNGVNQTFALVTALDVADPQSARTFNMLLAQNWPLAVGGAALLLFGAGVAIVRTGIVPRWLGWVGIVIGVVSLLGPGGFVGILVTPFWIIVVGVMLFMRAGSEVPNPAAGQSASGV